MFDLEDEEKKKKDFARIVLQNEETKKEKKKMLELAKEFLGKECYVYLFGDTSYVKGTLVGVTDGGVVIENKYGKEFVNAVYIIRISVNEK